MLAAGLFASALYACDSDVTDDARLSARRAHEPATASAPAANGDDAGGDDPPVASVPAPPWAPDGGTGAPPPPTPELDAAQCGGCHATIYKQWRQAMHSNALVSPVMVAQTNEDVAGPLKGTHSPDPEKFCVNCHGPTVAAITPGAELPLPDATRWRDGITCTTCHQFNGQSKLGGGGFASQFQQGFISGRTYLGNVDSPVGNRAHQSEKGTAFADPNQLCMNCHEVWIDLNKDGVEEKGIDLVLQTTWNEYRDYRTFGGKETCVSCHMPVTEGVTRIADGAAIPTDQFATAPPRVVHDHSFVGPDHLLDSPAQGAAQAAQRKALLQQAINFTIDRDSVGSNGRGIGFDVSIENKGAGHDLPTGFAFARQMWIEVTTTDAAGNVVDGSGVLATTTDDLCDGETLNDDFANPMPRFFQGCKRVDGDLTTFQQKLVSEVDVNRQNRFLHQDTPTAAVQDDFGTETWLQFLRGGVVARRRFNEGGDLAQLLPFEVRRFHYDLSTGGGRGKIVARVLFRSLPPYFMRALAQGGVTGAAAITPLIGNLEVVEMGRDEVSF